MKKLFAKLGMNSLLTVALVLGGLFFSANSAQAQTLTGAQQTTSGIKTTATWKNSNDALQALQDELTYIETSLNNSPTNELKAKFYIYTDIKGNLESGMEVPNAALAGFYQHAPGSMEDTQVTPGMPQAAWTSVYNDMIGLLTL
jgi:catalase (peroxidase I)